MDLDFDIFGARDENQCRVCLTTEPKLYPLANGLQHDFYNITGIKVTPTDGLPQYICCICREILRKATVFRKQSISAQNILSSQPATNNSSQTIVITPLISFIQTDVLLISIPEESLTDEIDTSKFIDDDLVKKENIQKPEDKDKFNEPGNTVKAEVDELFPDDFLELEEEVIGNINKESEKIGVAKEVNNIKQTAKSKAKTKPKKAVKTTDKLPKQNKGDPEMDTQSVKEYLLSINTANIYAQMLYSFLINKYIDKTKEFNIDKADNDYEFKESDDESPLSKLIKLEDNASQIDEILDSNRTDPSKMILYEFIKERYILKKAPASKRRARDLVRIKFKKDLKVVKSQEAMEELKKQYNMEIIHLSLEEQIAEVRDRAKTQAYDNATYKCEECFRGFQFERTYNDHMKAHDPAISGKFKCIVCNKRFLNKRKMLKHQFHHKYQIICKDCGHICKSHHVAREHTKMHSGLNNYKCEYCFRVFSKYASRVNHIRTKHGSVQCDICYELMAPAGLKMHSTLRHKETFKCQYCDKSFNDSNALNTHTSYSINGVCNANERPCARCGESFSSESLWISHVEEHRRVTKLISRQRYYPTNRSETLYESSRKRHSNEEKATTEPERCVMCEMCGDMFISQAAMRYHQRIHTGEKPFQCNYCSKRFRLKTLLTPLASSHLMGSDDDAEDGSGLARIPQHNGELAIFVPEHINAVNIEVLRQNFDKMFMHINTHTGERPHKCQKCPKTFKCPTAVYRHQLVHTKERRHRCTLCDKTFQTSTCVKLHIRTVHLKIPMPPRVRNRKKRAE